jgi:hypothetical protein
MEDERLERLERFIKSLPEPEQKRVILVVGSKTLSWEDILEELKRKGDLSLEIEKKLMERIK